jgi:hypothetical protein
MINDRPGRQNDGPYRFRIEESYFDGKPWVAFQKLTTLELWVRYLWCRTHILMHELPPTSTPLHRLAWIEYEHDFLFRRIEGRDSRARRVKDRANQILELLVRYRCCRTHIAMHDLPPTSTPLHRLAWIEYEHDLLFRMIEGRDSRSRRVKDRANQITPVPAIRIEAGEGAEAPSERLKGMGNDTPKMGEKSEANRKSRRAKGTEHGKETIGEQGDADKGRTMENNRTKAKAGREPRRPEKTEHGKSPPGEREDTDQGRTKKRKQDREIG